MMVPCPECRYPVPDANLLSGAFQPCPICGAESLIRIFPARFAPAVPAPAQPAMEGDATCFDHATKRAAAACSQCGRFLCSLCATEFRGATWCPSCLQAGAAKKKRVDLESSRTLWDSAALITAALPMTLVSPTLLGAPATLFLVFRYWKRPLSIVRRNRWRFVLAAVLALGQIAFWAALIVGGIMQTARTRP